MRRSYLVGVTATALAAVGALAGPATAAPDPITLTYKCPFPLIGTQTLSIEFSAPDAPASVTVGTPSPSFTVKTVTTVPKSVAQGMGLVGGKTIEGTALASATVAAPEGNLPQQVNSVLEKTAVPSPAAAFTVKSTSDPTPSVTFKQAGQGKILINDIDLKLMPRKADGSPTSLGEVNSKCVQDPGQNNVLGTFTIAAARL